jgi:hypothetical protein
MLRAPSLDLSEAFCSHCGHRPGGVWRERCHRVCRRCRAGVVLRAPPRLAPHQDSCLKGGSGRACLVIYRRMSTRMSSRRRIVP